MSTASIEGIVVVCKRGLVSMLRNVGSAGREISKEEGINHFAFFYHVALGGAKCVRVMKLTRAIVSSSSRCVWLRAGLDSCT